MQKDEAGAIAEIEVGLAVAEQAGIRLPPVHALDDEARALYEHFGFEASPTDSANVQLLRKDIRFALDESGLGHLSAWGA